MKTPSTAMPALRRIALFLHGLSEGGAQRRALSLAQNLVERGLAVDLLVVEAQGPLRPSLAPMVAAGDVAALSQVMERALTQPADTQALRRRAQEFSFKPATDDFIDVLRLAQRQRLDKRSK